jgi:hypothetical protein
MACTTSISTSSLGRVGSRQDSEQDEFRSGSWSLIHSAIIAQGPCHTHHFFGESVGLGWHGGFLSLCGERTGKTDMCLFHPGAAAA